MVLDIAATVVAFLIAAWGTKAGEIDLASPFFMGQMALLSLVNVAVFGVFRHVQQPLGVCERGRCGRALCLRLQWLGNRDVLGALVFDARIRSAYTFALGRFCWSICGMARFAIRVNSKGRSWSFLGAESPGQARTLIVGAGESGSLVVSRYACW